MARSSEGTVNVKEHIINKLHADLGIEKNVIRAVLEFQNKSLLEAMNSNTSIELAGFGRFTLIENRVDGRKAAYLKKIASDQELLDTDDSLSLATRVAIQAKIDKLNMLIIDLNKKKNVLEVKRNSRRVAK